MFVCTCTSALQRGSLSALYRLKVTGGKRLFAQDPYDIMAGVRVVGEKGAGMRRNKEKMKE